jgi:hypothetical protein
MRKATKRRPSPAMIVAILALVMAMAGTSVAAINGQINGGSIKKQTIGAGKLKKKTLTGFQIDTAKLGTVPSATSAQTAQSAQSAATAQTAVTAQSAQTATQAESLSPSGTAAVKTRWLLLNEQGQIEEQSGGFTVIDAYATNANVYIDAGSSLVGHGLTGSIAIQNKIDTSGDGVADPNFSGQVSVARCQTAAVECAPAGAKTVNALVVSPRTASGEATAGTPLNPRKRVYVEITE